MDKYTNKAVSKILDIHPERWKRWTRDFLPANMEAGRQMGKARLLTTDEVFKAWLGGRLIERRVPSAVGREILRSLFRWMDDRGYFPIVGCFNPDRVNLMNAVEIMVTFLQEGFEILAEETIGDIDFSNAPIMIKKYQVHPIKEGGTKEKAAPINTVHINIHGEIALFAHIFGINIK